jgi:hypothetical protein
MSSLVPNPSVNQATVSIPEFRDMFMNQLAEGMEDPKTLSKNMLKRDWLTPDLRLEIQSLFPEAHEKDDSGLRNHESYERKISILFPPGRVFASFTQLVQASKLFLDAWAIQKVHQSKKITCHYGNTGKSPSYHPNVSKQRKQKVSLKAQDCPFFISYALMGVIKSAKKPDVFYLARVVSVNYTHTCCMSTIAHRVALRVSGQAQPNLEGMNSILSLLREQPGLPNTILRPLLQKYLPHYKSMDPSFMRNFRIRALRFIIHNTSQELSLEDVNMIASTSRPVAAEEVINLDQPILLQNFTTLLRKCMQESSNTWIAVRYLDETKDLVPGFDYRIHKDPDGCPDGIVWMTPNMKLNLLQYGKILFLDAQKRQFNTSNWPYIGPAMKDCEERVCVAAECLCIQECLEMYIWILQMLVEMEPRYQLSQTAIIFADELITPSVLVQLGIHNTCTLRGDHHHLLNEVWPKAVGTYYTQMRWHMEAMFSSKTIEEYQIGYTGARQVLHEDPAMCSKLDVFYDQPEHYGGYYLRGLEEHLGLKGDVAAEQNHSSVCAHLGEGATWQIAEQVSKLLRRQQEQGKQRNEKEATENARTHRYQTRFKFQAGADDILARKALSMKGYSRFITYTLKPSTKLQYRTDSEGTSYVWPAGRL